MALSASDPVGSTFNQSFTYGVTNTAPDASTNFSITATATTNLTTTTDGFNQSSKLRIVHNFQSRRMLFYVVQCIIAMWSEYLTGHSMIG